VRHAAGIITVATLDVSRWSLSASRLPRAALAGVGPQAALLMATPTLTTPADLARTHTGTATHGGVSIFVANILCGM
jgi:hypothetical protein